MQKNVNGKIKQTRGACIEQSGRQTPPPKTIHIMEFIPATLKLATKVTEALKSVNIAEDNIVTIGFDRFGTQVHVKDCPEAYSFINVMQAKVKLRVTGQRGYEGKYNDHVITNYLTATQLPLEVTISKSK